MAAIDASGVMDVDASGVLGVAPPIPPARSWFCVIAAVVTTSIVLIGLIIGIVATMALGHAGPWATTTTTFTTTTSTTTTSTWTGHEDVDHLDFAVGSYNLFWWCVSNEYNTCRGYGNGKGFKLIEDVIIKNGPYDFIGFQECDDINIILKGAGLSDSHDFYKPQADAPMAWSKKFTKIGSPGQVTVATDKYGPRFMNWVRLVHLPTGKTIFFANTHGPLGQCSTALGQTYLDSIAKYMKPEDHLILTGDFNCPTTSATLKKIKSVYFNAATGDLFAGADHVLVSTDVKLLKASTPVGRPSDHNILLATVRMPVKYSVRFTV